MGRVLTLKIFSRMKGGKKYFGIYVPARFAAKGKATERFFRTRADAERFKLELLAAWREQDGIPLSAHETADARAAWRLMAENGIHGVSLAEVVRRALPMLQRGGQMHVAAVFAEYADAKMPTWRPKTERGFRFTARRFLESFGEREIASIEPTEIFDWLQSVANTAATRLNIRRTLEPVFNWAIRQEIISRSPWDRVEKERNEASSEIDVLTIAETRKLLEIAPDDCKATYALMLFSGIRPQEIERLKWSDIHDGFVHITPKIAKTRQVRNVEISPNLAAWLALPRREYNEKIIPPNWKRKNQATRRAAGISNRPDVCRHSFASYHLVEHENVDRLKMQLGHSRVSDTLFAHYRAAVSKAAAREYWCICPPGVSVGCKNRRSGGRVTRSVG